LTATWYKLVLLNMNDSGDSEANADDPLERPACQRLQYPIVPLAAALLKLI
jgi:hypothetical protein